MAKTKRLKQSEIENYLQDLDGFEDPKIHLEQYATQPHVASMMIHTIDNCYDDLKGKMIADLGCGAGILSMGSMLLDALVVYGFDIDDKALNTCLANANNLFNEENSDDDDETDEGKLTDSYKQGQNINLIRADIGDCDGFWERFNNKFDVCITNPPFGTKHNKGIDMVFLKRAINLATDSVYSLHKSSTRGYIRAKCRQWQVFGEPIAQIKYDLPKTYKFHQKSNVDVEVDLWRVTSLPQVPIK